jgi:hypothetical protein
MTVGAEKRSDSRPSGTTACQSGTTACVKTVQKTGRKRPKAVLLLVKAVLPLERYYQAGTGPIPVRIQGLTETKPVLDRYWTGTTALFFFPLNRDTEKAITRARKLRLR